MSSAATKRVLATPIGKTRRFAGKYRRIQSCTGKARALYERADQIMRELLDAGLKPGDRIKIADDRYAVLLDNYPAGTLRTYRAHGIPHYEFVEVHAEELKAELPAA